MKVSQVLLVEGVVNFLVAILKGVVGLQTGSTAILADAFHSFTDTANNGMAYAAHRIANKPADKCHPYGHRKYEYLAIFVLAVLLSVLALELIVHALTGFTEQPEQSQPGIWLMVGSVIATLGVAGFEAFWARRLNSVLLEADAKHSLADVSTTVAAVAGWQIALLGFPWLDSVIAVIIALFVFYLAYGLFRKVIPVLVDEASLNENQIVAAANDLPGIIRVKQVKSRSTGDGDILEIKATVSPYISTKASHHIADQLEEHLTSRFNLLDVVVHIEPD